jgi:hypothetical protein
MWIISFIGVLFFQKYWHIGTAVLCLILIALFISEPDSDSEFKSKNYKNGDF